MENSDISLPSPPRGYNSRGARGRTTVASNAPTGRVSRLSFGNLDAPPSSDPPLFSSDDFQSSALENYTSNSHEHDAGTSESSHSQQPLRKRRYRGTWWGEQIYKKKTKRTAFKDKRNVDSGVWLASGDSSDVLVRSDDSALSFGEYGDSGALDEECYQEEQPAIDREILRISSPVPPGHERTAAQISPIVKRTESEQHARARAAIIRCLEEANENVDLSYFNLETIPTGLLRPLVQLTKEPAVDEPPSGDEAYSPLEPSLRLFLTRNLLTSVPGEVFELPHLRVLSLRHNKLTEIPCAIRNLTLLQELTVAGNRLTHLPWEVLRLMQEGELRQLTVHPNPFVGLDEADIAQWHCRAENENDADTPPGTNKRLKASTYTDLTPPAEAWVPLHVATSKVQYLDVEGRPVPHLDTASASLVSSSVAVPSLRELCLRACARSPLLPRLLDPDDPDNVQTYLPTPILRLLATAKQVRDAGGRTCSVCSREYVIPRCEWVEWWDCITFENGSKVARKSGQDLYPLPFMRRGCSWACSPKL